MQSVNIAINGLGRIGRCVLRAIYENKYHDLKLVAINGTATLEQSAHLLKYDSIHGRFQSDVRTENGNLIVDGSQIKYLSDRDPANLDWKGLGVDIVLECTGKLSDKESALKHIKSGAKKVVLSSPSPSADATVVYGVNNEILNETMQVVSVGSCTTNALAPIAKLLNDHLGIESGYMTTIHSYTSDQNLLDNPHKDPRRARSCNMSMIPTSTGAAKTIGLIIPELAGKLDGSAIRVPVPNVSMIDLCFTSSRDTSVEEINQLMSRNSSNVLEIAQDKLVSIDFNHTNASSIFDPFETRVVNKRFVRVVTWYDNEWGFSNRMLDVTRALMSLTQGKYEVCT